MDREKTDRREEHRAQLQRQQQHGQRLLLIGLIGMGAILLVFTVIWKQLGSAGGSPPAPSDAGQVVTATPVALPGANGLSLGDPNAAVTIDAFEDFQCPACKYFTETIETLVIQNLVNTGKARYVFHPYPFLDGGSASEGGESDQAANAAMCANEQGKFWDMHATLFANWNGENQGAFSDVRLQAMAKSIGLDTKAFDDCFTAKKYQSDIQADMDLGLKMGVSGTPTVFVNGVRAGQPGKIATYQEIEQAVEQALKK